MNTLIERLTAAPPFALLARIVLTLMFWLSGIAKLADFPAAIAEMRHFGLEPAVPIAVAVIAVQLVGSALVISGRHVWLGAGMLGVFTVLTIPIAHAFWTMDGERAFLEMMFAFEHISVIGGLMVVAAFGEARRRAVPTSAPA
ncbi:DoxX family protein [Pleomorphomonas sp. PLEO]|uniref:DoxX family protein n=1 Tax=Pleomorphomonas sp. PLEO TaxID=3239306 RepID=UPI00351E6E26